ncbi:MAG: TRAP transporter substrate-binding protein [Peptococcaceae bacterium]|nr:TRAP transporter substrate-binding protein [Peptococcaceae bacterium]
MVIRIALVLCLFLLPGLAAGCGKRVVDLEQVSPEEKIVIKFSHVVAENTPKGLAAQRFADLVRERTRGRVEVQVFPNSTLYKDGEELQALQNGSVQIIAPATSKLAGLFPQWQVFDLPYAFPDEDAVHRAMDGYIGNKLSEILRQSNIQALAFWDNGFKQITNSKRPVIHPGDFNGLTFRVMINSQVLKRQFEKMGAIPVEKPFNDLYRVLELREVDGQENTMSNICSKNLFKVQPYLTVSNHGYMGYMVMTNARFWSALPEDIRAVLEGTLLEVTGWEREQALKMNRENMEKAVSSGQVQVHWLTENEKEEWARVLEPIYGEFREIIGGDLIDAVEELNRQRRERNDI